MLAPGNFPALNSLFPHGAQHEHLNGVQRGAQLAPRHTKRDYTIIYGGFNVKWSVAQGEGKVASEPGG